MSESQRPYAISEALRAVGSSKQQSGSVHQASRGEKGKSQMTRILISATLGRNDNNTRKGSWGPEEALGKHSSSSLQVPRTKALAPSTLHDVVMWNTDNQKS